MSHQLPLRRDPDGQVYLDGTGPVSVQVDFHTVLGNGGQGAVFMGRIFDMGGALVKEVRAIMHGTHSYSSKHGGGDGRIQRGACLFLSVGIKELCFFRSWSIESTVLSNILKS